LTGIVFAADSDKTKSIAPLFDGLGNHHHPITTPSKQARTAQFEFESE